MNFRETKIFVKTWLWENSKRKTQKFWSSDYISDCANMIIDSKELENNKFDTLPIRRIWSMPNKSTFTIKPIKELIENYVQGVIVDPFANNSKYGTITNDLNPEYDTEFHVDALDFLKALKDDTADVVLFDPPYSLSQAAQCYKNYGKDKLKKNVTNMRYWSDCKNEVARITKSGGIVIICGWNSNGLGINRGFKMKEILIVPHGGSKNDTIVTVEYKIRGNNKKFYGRFF